MQVPLMMSVLRTPIAVTKADRMIQMAAIEPYTRRFLTLTCKTISIILQFILDSCCGSYPEAVERVTPTKICTMFDRLLGWYTIYTFSEALAP